MAAGKMGYDPIFHRYNAYMQQSDISRTEQLIRRYVRRTPVIEVRGSDLGAGVDNLVLKLELLQHTASFKPRGAFANLLTHEVPAAGVVAASGGNHGAAVSFAARTLGKPATIFVPTVTSQAKRDRIAGYGARLIITGDYYADALAASEQWAADSGALRIHAYDQVEQFSGRERLDWSSSSRILISTPCLLPLVAAGLSAESQPGTANESG